MFTRLCALGWIRLRQGHGIVDALVSAVTFAVAAIPEEFPIVRVAHQLPAEGVDARQLAEVAALASRVESGGPLDAAIQPLSERSSNDSPAT